MMTGTDKGAYLCRIGAVSQSAGDRERVGARDYREAGDYITLSLPSLYIRRVFRESA